MMIQQRSEKKPEASLKDRLVSFAADARAEAAHLPAGDERDDLIKRARCADIAAHLDEWVNAPGLQPPK